MNTLEEQARDSLSELVKYVLAHQDGMISGMTYQELATRIGRLNKHNKGHAHGMGRVLGTMGHLLQGLEGRWGERIPQIQSLVVNKAGVGKNLPDDGIKEFWPDYPNMSLVEQENCVRLEHQRVVEFGSRWNYVLARLGLPEVDASSMLSARPFGRGGESQAHKALKEYIKEHPKIVGATTEWQAFVEYPLPSLDAIDVLFKSKDAWIAVEVKSRISDNLPADYERGLYQVVKYDALLQAMRRSSNYNIPARIHCLLVLESGLPEQYRGLSKTLGVKVLANIKVECDG